MPKKNLFKNYTKILILTYRVPPPKKKKNQNKTEPMYFWLKFINLILAFSFFLGYEVDSVHEKLGP